MKKHRKSVVVLVLLTAGMVAGGAAVFASGLGLPAQTPAVAAQATPAGQPARERAVIAKGQLAPVQHAALSMPAAGIVDQILVREGEPVAARQVILRLQNLRQQAALAEADAALATARAQLETLQAGPRAEEVAVAQAALDAAQARRARLGEAGRPSEIAAARAAADAAAAAMKRLYDGPDENTRTAAAADLANAEATLRAAQAAYDKIKDQPDRAMYPQSLQLEQATNAYRASLARYNELSAPPTADRVAQANAQVKRAQADLDRLLAPATAAEVAEADAMVRQAQSQLRLLEAGARQQQIAAAAAGVAQAEAARRGAAAILDETELRAPFAGTLVVLYARAGEQIGPGTPVAEIGDLTAWQVETDDLSELDVARVQPGRAVDLTFDALPGLTVKGIVERIQAKGEKKLGDMTYTAIVRIAEPDPRLLWNMTAVMNVP